MIAHTLPFYNQLLVESLADMAGSSYERINYHENKVLKESEGYLYILLQKRKLLPIRLMKRIAEGSTIFSKQYYTIGRPIVSADESNQMCVKYCVKVIHSCKTKLFTFLYHFKFACMANNCACKQSKVILMYTNYSISPNCQCHKSFSPLDQARNIELNFLITSLQTIHHSWWSFKTVFISSDCHVIHY